MILVQEQITAQEVSAYNPDIKIQNFLTLSNEKIIVSALEEKRDNLDLSKEEVFTESNLSKITDLFPFFKNIFENEKRKVSRNYSEILRRFTKEKNELFEHGLISSLNENLVNVDIGIGDFHNGASTTLVELSDKNKLVFKPTNGAISQSFFCFLDWVNDYINLGEFKHNLLNKKEYHWQEFVFNKECSSEKDIHDYYYRAGSLLCILYLLNSSDFHSENIIANGNSPLLIDHETVIQPKIADHNKRYFKQFNDQYIDTVLDSFLLPNYESRNIFPIGMCGLGFSKQTHKFYYKKEGVNRYTQDWRMVTGLKKEEYVKNNLPILNGEKHFADKYIKNLIVGFESCYDLFLDKKEELLSDNSPINYFKDLPVRYIWRATRVYGKILEFMKLPKNLNDKNSYEKQIKDYLSVAFKEVPHNHELRLIIDHEITQMMRGDIPYFEVNSSSKNLVTEKGIIKDFFDFSCIGNIERKIKKLSKDDLNYQKELIMKAFM